jgi:hypothetical protein
LSTAVLLGLERFVAAAPAEIYAVPIREVRAWLTSTRAT